jgi:hypothetical protein
LNGDYAVDKTHGIATDYFPISRGGASISTFLQFDHSTSSFYTPAMQLEHARHQHGFIEYMGEYPRDGDGTAQNEYSQAENDWWSDCAIVAGLDVSIHESKDEIELHLWLNYTDAPYFRFQYAETILKHTMSFDDFLYRINEGSMVQQLHWLLQLQTVKVYL